MSIYSSFDQLTEMRRLLANYARLPTVQASIPGSIMESVLAYVRGGIVLSTYDFVDVVQSETSLGWQVKSTKANTPVTWMRAKLPDAPDLIRASRESDQGVQELGNAIIDYCNQHVLASIQDYNLKKICYARLIVHKDRSVVYFERLLCSQHNPQLFDPSEFIWNWSTPKKTVKKEQLPALHGFHRSTRKRWWAWHGLGENQLHFTGESVWWPEEDDHRTFTFKLPPESDKLTFDQLMNLLSSLES